MPTETFAPHGPNWIAQPIRNLGLAIKGTRLEPILAEFALELEKVGIRKVKPVFYLSTEWGVPTDTVAIAIPFYLAHPDLVDVHTKRVGHVEGVSRHDILRYLRHEMGHAVNYAYRLYDLPEWVKHFGSMSQPYLEDYRPKPFSRRFVRHLPGWYAQKHPDEDWAETFAVWMTPGLNWRSDYASWPRALEKLQYCDEVMTQVGDQDPVVTAADLDEDVSQLAISVDEFYAARSENETEEFPGGIDGALRSIFEDVGVPEDPTPDLRRPASELLRDLEVSLQVEVYRWTGHFPERTRRLLRHLGQRMDELGQVYPIGKERQITLALTTFICALAMNHVHTGSYLP